MVTNQPDISVDDSIKKIAVRWLFGQEANTVALYFILAALFYGAWYMVNTGIPKHLEQIHSGYKEINDQNIKDRTEARQAFEKTLDRIQQMHGLKSTGSSE